MNKHGQTLILFVLLIPIILMFCAFIIDTGIVINNKSHLKEVSKTIIEESIDNPNEEEIKALFIKNKIETRNLQINIKEQEIEIKNEYEIDSVFGTIIGINKYKIKIQIRGKKENNKIFFE